MDKNLQNIENLFRDSLEDNEEIPSPHVWNGIDNILNKDDIASFKKKYNTLKSIALLLLFLLLGLSIYELTNRNGNNDNTKKNKQGLSKSIVNNDTTSEVSIHITHLKRANNNNRISKNYNGIPVKPGDILIPGNKSTNSTISNRTNIPANFANSEFIDPFKSKGAYKATTKNASLVKDNEQVVNNESEEAGIRIDTVKSSEKDFADIKKPSGYATVNKIILPVAKKNTVESTLTKRGGYRARFSIMPFFSPDVAWYNLEDDDDNRDPLNAAEAERAEKHEFSSTLGMLIEYKVKRRLSFQAGITYSNTNITVEPKILYAQPDNTGNIKYLFNTSSGYGYILPSFSNNPAVGDSLYALASVNTLKYIGIPMAVKYIVITKGKLTFNALAGMSVNFLTSGQIETTVERDFNKESETLKNIQGLKKVYLNGLTGLGVEYAPGKRIGLSFDPTLRFALNSINKNAPVKSYPKSIGFSTGIKISL